MQTIEQLDTLAEQALEKRDYQKAQEYAWQQLDIDPLHEPALQQLMIALARSGQRSAAMAQYEIYRKRLQETSGEEPSAELTELYQRIQNDELQQTMLRHPAAVSPDGVINPIFCYTDIESSTRLWDEHRETMLWALRQHNDLCETEIEKFDGRILHHTGDGFLIVFEQNDPLAFAISLQQQFARADWGEIGELRIRIGLHGSTADQEGHEFFHDAGGWYRGPVLNHAARIADTGHGGQIVASDMVKATCPLPPGASWEDLGSHNLKSLDEAYHIYGLRHPDLALQAFPALRTPANKKAASPVGSHIRGYDLGQMIGQGAFGEVYHAQQPGVGRPVAVKKSAPASPTSPNSSAVLKRRRRSSPVWSIPTSCPSMTTGAKRMALSWSCASCAAAV
jgi:class 3 adenylate cyclase